MIRSPLAPNEFLLSWAESQLREALGRSPLPPFEIFAQGSRVNGTHVETSDIDLVLMLKNPSPVYGWEQFRDDVLKKLGESWTVRMGRRCLNVDDPGSLFGEMVDILVAVEHEGGVFFRDRQGRPIVNFPKQHRLNGDAKDLRTGYKEVVRAAKRERILDVPPYLLECLLYNVPDDVYRRGGPETAFDWLRRLQRDDPGAFAALPCQNGINRIFGPGPDQWTPGDVVFPA